MFTTNPAILDRLAQYGIYTLIKVTHNISVYMQVQIIVATTSISYIINELRYRE